MLTLHGFAAQQITLSSPPATGEAQDPVVLTTGRLFDIVC